MFCQKCKKVLYSGEFDYKICRECEVEALNKELELVYAQIESFRLAVLERDEEIAQLRAKETYAGQLEADNISLKAEIERLKENYYEMVELSGAQSHKIADLEEEIERVKRCQIVTDKDWQDKCAEIERLKDGYIEKHHEIERLKNFECGKCGRSLAPDGDCHGCRADRLEAEIERLKKRARGDKAAYDTLSDHWKSEKVENGRLKIELKTWRRSSKEWQDKFLELDRHLSTEDKSDSIVLKKASNQKLAERPAAKGT